MIDVNLLPRELTGYVGYVCWQWFERHFSRDEVPYIRGGACGLVPDLRDNLIDVVQNCFADGGLDDETVGRFVALYATLPFDVDEARRLAENDFRYVADADTRLAFELCVLVFDAMFPQHVEVRQTDVDGTLEHIAFPASWQHDLAVSSTPENRMSAYRNGLSAVRKAYDKMFDRLGEADRHGVPMDCGICGWRNPRAPSQVSGRCGGVSGCGSACRWPVSDALHCR